MSAKTQHIFELNIKTEIEFHPAWLGHVSGLFAEKMIRHEKQPFLYVLRKGELEDDYYVTFLDANLQVKHQPFTLTITPQGWCYENLQAGGPYKNSVTIEDVLHLIMHCDAFANKPYTDV